MTTFLYYRKPLVRLLLLGGLPLASAHAAYEDLGVGARAPGMANAFVAAADDVYAIHYNPAGLGLLERPQLGASYTKLYRGLTDNSDLGSSFIGYAHPLSEGRYGALGAAWNTFSLNNLYREDTLYLSYGRLAYTDVRGGELNAGLSLKYLRSSFGSFPEATRATDGNLGVTTRPDPVLSGSSSQGAIDSDLGFLYRFARHYAVGLQMTHVNQPNVAFSSGDTDRLPLGIKMGVNYGSLISSLLAQYETQRSPANTRDHVLTVAAERWFPKLFVGDFGVRGGVGFGSREYAQLAMGLSYRVRRFVLDYAFGIPLRGPTETSGSHRFGLTFRFGRASDEEESLEMVLEAMREMRTTAPARPAVDTAGLSPAERSTLEERLAHSRFFEMSGRYREALDRLDDALRIAPKEKELLARRVRLVQVALNFPQLPDFRRDPVESAVHQGARAYLAGQDALAVQKLSSALSLRPEDQRISTLLDAVERETGARRPATLPGRRSPSYELASRLTRAESALEEKLFGEAVEAALEVLREDGENAEAWQVLGTAYFGLKDYKNSLEAWRKAFDLQKSPSLRAVISGHIRSIERLLGRGRVEERTRPVPASSAVPQPKPRLSAQEIRELYDQGLQHYLRRDLESARKAFGRILESDPFNEEASKAMRRIREEQP